MQKPTVQFVKVQKGPSYYSRYQVKYRRRRQGKTNYYKRRRMVVQDKTKFNTPKYRFVVRISNKCVTTQIIWSKINGDQVLCSAYSTELPQYGFKVGLKNYPAVYCTSFLCGRRLLHKIGLHEKYESVDKIHGDKYLVDPEEEVEGAKPFKCFLDIGMHRATLGARVFAALKGACDAGLYIPHKVRKFPGFNSDTKKYDAEKHRERIMGIHIQKNQEMIKEADEEKYKKMFPSYVKLGVTPGMIPEMVEKTIENIKKDPVRKQKKEGEKPKTNVNKYHHKQPKLHLNQKKQKIAYKKRKLENKLRYLNEKNKE